MGKNLVMLGMIIVVMTLITVTIIGFISGITNPIPWISLSILIIVMLAHNKLTKKNILTWKDSYSVGIESIDNDHKKLIMLINNLQTAKDFKTDPQFEKQTLDEVINYTLYHFEREESFMEENGYPDFLPHKAKHQELIYKVNEYVKTYNKGGDGAIEALLKYLKTWLISHINGTDQEYAEFLRSKGVK